jgi:glycosyltransferase involved in cell wall biosynthesis
VLFLGTLEPRKNIGTLLDAWAMVRARGNQGSLVLAGGATAEAAPWLRRLTSPELGGSVSHLGYVDAADRERLYAGARALVLPSLDEGFGLTALEAMSAGVPVVASTRGSLPEVVGDAGVLVDPTDARALAGALERMLTDRRWATEHAEAGLRRARTFTWSGAAMTLRQAYREAVARRHAEQAAGAHRH